MTQITADEFAGITATTFLLLCGKARTRELTRLSIERLQQNGCHPDGSHPLLDYAVALKDVVAERNRPDEIEAMIVVIRQISDLAKR
jgi:hypothetical protein